MLLEGATGLTGENATKAVAVDPITGQLIVQGASGGSSRTKTVYILLGAVTTNQTSTALAVGGARRTVQASIAGTGAVAATVSWYGSNLNAASGGVLLATSTLSGTTTDVTGADIPAEWPFVYCILTGISGTDAEVTATIGV